MGRPQHLDSFVCLAVRSGVGAGIVLDGKLFGGSHGFAGEPGYAPVTLGQDARAWKHLQDVVSESAMGVDVEASDFALSEGKAARGELIGRAGDDRGPARPAGDRAGGRIAPAGGAAVGRDRAGVFRQMVFPELADRVQILPAQVGPFAAAMGAAHRCFEMLYPLEPA